MKIIGILALNDKGVFQVLPLVGMPEIKESVPESTDTPTGIITPLTPEMDRVSKEEEKPKNLDEVLKKNKE